MPAWTEPRTPPPARLPAAAGASVGAVALPIFLIAGWRVSGGAIGAGETSGGMKGRGRRCRRMGCGRA